MEQTSIDEGYFDLTANRKKSPVEIALTIRKAIGQGLKITVSEGIASNKLVSAGASKLTKPAAFHRAAICVCRSDRQWTATSNGTIVADGRWWRA